MEIPRYATEVVPQNTQEVQMINPLNFEQDINSFIYISDLHLESIAGIDGEEGLVQLETRLAEFKESVVRQSERGNVKCLLVGGDISNGGAEFDFFIEVCREIYQELRIPIFIVLGNHDYWCEGEREGLPTIESIVSNYKERIRKRVGLDAHVYLLQNDIATIKGNEIKIIREEELCGENGKTLLEEEIENIDMLILGGTGFAGTNRYFNADTRMYLDAVSREREVVESIQFCKIHRRVEEVGKGKKIVVLTHMPIKDWGSGETLIRGGVYVNGHTHKNEYRLGVINIFSNRQVVNDRGGSWYYVSRGGFPENTYQIGKQKGDGIHPITLEEYQSLCIEKGMGWRSKVSNVQLLVNGEVTCLAVYTGKGKTQKVSILSGGRFVATSYTSMEQLYSDMLTQYNQGLAVVSRCNVVLNEISEGIKSLGYAGVVHGCIVDWDYTYHTYVNPLTLNLQHYYQASSADMPTFFEGIERVVEGRWAYCRRHNTLDEATALKVEDQINREVAAMNEMLNKVSESIKQQTVLPISEIPGLSEGQPIRNVSILYTSVERTTRGLLCFSTEKKKP